MKLTEIKEKMGSLERVLEQDVAKKKKIPSVSKKLTQSKSSVNLPGQDDSSSGQEASVPDDEKDLEPTPLAVADAAFEDDPNDEVLELGVKVGKFRCVGVHRSWLDTNGKQDSQRGLEASSGPGW